MPAAFWSSWSSRLRHHTEAAASPQENPQRNGHAPAEVVDGIMGRMDRREQHTELLPLLEGATGFDVVLRGYDRHQVHEHVERLEADLRIALAERNATAARTAGLSSQLARAHREIESLRSQLSEAQAAEPTMESMSDRI